MPREKSELLSHLLVALILALGLARFLAVSQAYPFYLIHDMDQIAALDTMLIHSGELPDHLNHTCFGMYLLQTQSTRVARALGMLSATTLGDLESSLNPINGFAELTAYLRLNTPYLELLMVILLWTALCLLLRPTRWIGLLFLVLLVMQESLIYHASMIRTELYAMFYWSAALCLLGLGLRARTRRSLQLTLLGAGLCLGLCFTTKVQSFFHLIAFGLLALLALTMVSRQRAVPIGEAPSPRQARGMAILATVNLAFYLLMLLAVQWIRIPEGFATFTKSYRPNTFTFVFGAAALGMALAGWRFVRQGRTSEPSCGLLGLFTLLFSGFLATFFLHFLLYANPATSLTYMLYDFKMVFCRELSWQQTLPYIIKNPVGFYQYLPTMFGVQAALLGILVAGHYGRFIEVTPRQLLLCGALTGLVFLLPWVAVRYFLRDIVWVEILTVVLDCFYVTLIWRGARRHVPRLRGAAVALLLFFLAIETLHGLAMPHRIDMNINQYGWNVNRWRQAVYAKNQLLFESLMNRHYTTPMWPVAREVVRDEAWIRKTAAFVFQNQSITHRQLGLVSEEFPVWTHYLEYRIDSFSPELRNSIVVDSTALPLRNRYFARQEYVNEHSEFLDKTQPPPEPGLLAVLPRADLRIYLFIHADDLERVPASLKKKDPPKIVLRNADRLLEMTGIELKYYYDIPVGNLTRAYFLVLRHR